MTFHCWKYWSIFFLLCANCLFSQPGDKKFFGSIWQGRPDPNFAKYFDQITPENQGKWRVVNWNGLDGMYDFADDNNLLVKQHTFVWSKQQPGNVNSSKMVEDWIRSYMERYGDNVHLIDVVNEAQHIAPYYINVIGGKGNTGWDWVIWCYETARKYAPNSKLLINDFGILKSEKQAKTYLSLINLLLDRGLLDGIGVQGHFLENTDANTIKNNLDLLAKTNLPIYISEFDLDIGSDQQHLKKMQEIFPVMWEHPAVAGVTLWGYQQGKMWRRNGYLMRSNGSLRPGGAWLMDFVEKNPIDAPRVGLANSTIEFKEMEGEIFFNWSGKFGIDGRYRKGGKSLPTLILRR